ncbi:MAG: Cof-type HAD-IIB family hydrolase [Anaerococcus sp.]|nr:Cof-type HAD-IIB family hydrolase [Anaerococcus sp.]
MIRLITIDVDGTLVTPLKRLTKKNKKAIKRARKLGVHIALVSGRPFNGLIDLIDDLGLSEEGHFSICQNGSYVVDNHTREVLFGTNQTPDALRRVDDLLKGYKLEVSAMDDKGFYTRHPRPNIYTRIDSKITGLPLNIVPYESFEPDKRFGRFLILGPSREIRRFIDHMPRALKEDYYQVQTAPFLIEVMSKNTNKGFAIRKVCEKRGFERGEVMAIGNEKNDIPMLKEAGFAVAMANAVGELKVHADFITRSNLRSGVAYAIDKLIENDLEKFV